MLKIDHNLSCEEMDSDDLDGELNQKDKVLSGDVLEFRVSDLLSGH